MLLKPPEFLAWIDGGGDNSTQAADIAKAKALAAALAPPKT